MIYLFSGTDEYKVRQKAFSWIEKAREKQPNLIYKRIEPEEMTEPTLEEVTQSGGLFVKRLLILLDDPFRRRSDGDDSENEKSSVEKYLKQLAVSDNAIIILAPKLNATLTKKISTLATQSYIFDEQEKGEKKRGFNFALVNALSMHDGKKLWVEIVRATREGDAPEMIHGLLHWKVRDMYEKGSRVWSKEELRKLSLNLITLIVDTRKKGLELGKELERFALGGLI